MVAPWFTKLNINKKKDIYSQNIKQSYSLKLILKWYQFFNLQLPRLKTRATNWIVYALLIK